MTAARAAWRRASSASPKRGYGEAAMPARGVVAGCKGLQRTARLDRVSTRRIGEIGAMLRFGLSDDCHLRLLEVADADELYRLIDASRDHLRP
jgi:hypothetical protein